MQKKNLAKVCTRCGVAKPLDKFYRKGGGGEGYRWRCKQCYQANYRTNKERIRAKFLMRTYNMSLADYDKMLERQEYGCAICGKSSEANGMRLSVDHDHKTSMVRGLLCNACNHGIGLFQDSPQRLRAAALYVEKQS